MSDTTEMQIGIASKIYEARRTLRRLLGDKYAQHASRWMAVVDAIRHDESLTELETGMKLLKDLQAKGDDGIAQLWVLASVVELIEPDAITPTILDPLV